MWWTVKELKEKKEKIKTEIIINKNTTPSLLFLCQFQDIKWEEIFLLKDSKYHKLCLWPHNENCIVTSLSIMASESKILNFYVCDEEKQFYCVFPITNKKNSLLTLIFKQITPNLEESICTPWHTCPPNLREKRCTDRKTDRQKQTDYNNPLQSSSVNYVKVDIN